MDLSTEFQTAIEKVNQLAQAPSQADMLLLYGHFKQATVGDATGKRPGMLDIKGRAKFDAWAKRRGLSKDDAMRGYLEVAKKLGAL